MRPSASDPLPTLAAKHESAAGFAICPRGSYAFSKPWRRAAVTIEATDGEATLTPSCFDRGAKRAGRTTPVDCRWILPLVLLLVGPAHAEGKMTFTLESSAFGDGDAIPSKYTCEGSDLSPPLAWTGVPANTRSLVLIVDDPDAPDPKAPKMTWVHWVLYDIPPEVTGLAEGLTSARLPSGAREGVNDWRRTGYGGPCPPVGRHRYVHKLYALDTRLEGLHLPTQAKLETAMQGHVIARAELVGTYQK
jgi:Raf kinase inhibitor-like YbhB/YbcL family protein